MRTKGDGPGAHFTPPALAKEHALQAFRIWNWATGQPDHRKASALDLGCGDGEFMLQAMAQGVDPGAITGVEVDEVSAENAANRTQGLADLTGYDYSPTVIRDDALFSDLAPHDIALGNPPWVGKVSQALGAGYAREVSRRFGPGYNASSDLSAAFVIRASELCDQISFLVTKTIMQGRTFRSGVQRLLLSGEWSMVHVFDEGARFTGMGVRPTSYVWPGAAGVHYVHVHLVRVSLERFECFRGGAHWAWSRDDV